MYYEDSGVDFNSTVYQENRYLETRSNDGGIYDIVFVARNALILAVSKFKRLLHFGVLVKYVTD